MAWVIDGVYNRPHRWMSVEERWIESFMPVTESGCHIWINSVDKDGYGQFRINGVGLKAHRHAWEKKHGAIPIGMHICHRCDVPSCVNADHMFLGTQKDNMMDMAKKGRQNKQRLRRMRNVMAH